MVNPKFSRSIKDLKGMAKVIAERNMEKASPAFFRFQSKYQVKEVARLKNDELPFVVGDRVQMIRGPERNKIGIIRAIYDNGNAYMIEGLGGSEKFVLPRELWSEGHSKPVVTVPTPVHYKNLRLVTKIKEEDGTEQDVAIHSIKYEGTYFDHHTNSVRKIRRAAHDSSIVIPYPRGEPVKPSKEMLATPADVADERTHFVTSILDSPVPIGAMDQIRNPYSRFRRIKDGAKVTAQDLRKLAPKTMPHSPATKKLLESLAQLPKKHTVPFTKDIESFIGHEVEKGLQKRVAEETAALASYK
ncbi:mitochondrial 54S ribosomal protein YmL40 [Sugiyamaella lignohabitans]|uniref:Mitochondrial 54S ribosomal protein YmL40 n=1 Tax=Sugiyamaella lignohabitans TaxID=796027 RepID=A0A167C804_9ASCO|nr:mitochondrial 54S ribosomal protein YmL40 [Sugiyamaella lignohabitans]ANB11336.1 mitochondrial 54S ribosomal protein YmL40 [Sugiyamaella lignohabitans]